MSSTTLVFTLPLLRFPPLCFPRCPPIFIAYALHHTHLHPSITLFPTSSLSHISPHFLRLCPPPHSSSPFHRFISHLFAFLDVPPFSSPMSSAALVFTLLSLHLPHLFTCPDVLHCLPPLQPLGWIISCPFPPPL